MPGVRVEVSVAVAIWVTVGGSGESLAIMCGVKEGEIVAKG
jgi:hypothetical protein